MLAVGLLTFIGIPVTVVEAKPNLAMASCIIEDAMCCPEREIKTSLDKIEPIWKNKTELLTFSLNSRKNLIVIV